MFGGPGIAKRASNTHQGRFEKRSEEERQLERSRQDLARTKVVLEYASWENRTHDEIAARRGKDRLLQMRNEVAETLQQRRKRLAEQRAREMGEWEHEVANNVETMEERRARIFEKATRMREAREAAKRSFVQEMYDKQWRDSCDDARTLDSKAMLNYVTEKRVEQLHEKEIIQAREAEESAIYTAKIEERMRYLEAQEVARDQRRHDMEQRTRHDLNAQVEFKAARRMASEEAAAAEENEELEHLRSLIEEEREKERRRKEQAVAKGMEVRVLNEQRAVEHKQLTEAERQQDLLLLKYAMAKDKAGEEQERQKREVEKTALRKYREYLDEQTKREAEDAGRLDAVQLEAQNRMWDARDAELRKRDDARRRLLNQVQVGRQEQIRLQKQREQENKAYFDEQVQFDRKAFEAAEAAEAESERRQRQNLLNQAARLREQMEGRAAIREQEKQEEYLQVKRMEAYERDHKSRLGAQAGKVVLRHPLKHTQWYT